MLLGLTGGYCAGKSSVAKLLAERGFAIVDADRLGHRALDLRTREIAARFGRGVIGADGAVDRKALGRIVFSDPAALADHEAIVHPAMLGLIDEEIAAAQDDSRRGAPGRRRDVCLDAALLYRFPRAASCDAIIEVRACILRRLARARERDGLGAREAFRRIMRQRHLWRMRPPSGKDASCGDSAVCIRFIGNSGSMEALEASLERNLESIRAEIATRKPS